MELYVCVLLLLTCHSISLATNPLIRQSQKPPGCSEALKTREGHQIAVVMIGWIDESSYTGKKGAVVVQTGNKPEVFRLGSGAVVQGLEEGLLGMCEGERRTLVVPPLLGYGFVGLEPDIPSNATLRFEVQLLAIDRRHNAMIETNVFAYIDVNKDDQITPQEFLAWVEATPETDRPKIKPMVMFLQEDKNRDGVISWDEFSGPKGHTCPAFTLESLRNWKKRPPPHTIAAKMCIHKQAPNTTTLQEDDHPIRDYIHEL
eukprot:gnl/Spiro4/12904_TR6836_c0_g1_i1.p1 gnl/Spiro4/12904_TR6836_c0_g1~~gnl/Spiro4/12904_TR6836_c0_g1_i1.p1  ORF type:complete len:259 (+),score=23.42 gnl/Spiro4/12904_TR6836_c0_g1_i1:56-832(+)